MNRKATLCDRQSNLIYISKFSQGFSHITALVIMQDLHDNGRQSSILDFIFAKFVIDHPCANPYILFHIYGPAILLCI